jgi:hypothetical protein
VELHHGGLVVEWLFDYSLRGFRGRGDSFLAAKHSSTELVHVGAFKFLGIFQTRPVIFSFGHAVTKIDILLPCTVQVCAALGVPFSVVREYT